MIKINDKGKSKIRTWLRSHANYARISDESINAWCESAEQSYLGPGFAVTIELSDRDSIGGEWLVLTLDDSDYDAKPKP